jgi:hypothetical protein
MSTMYGSSTILTDNIDEIVVMFSIANCPLYCRNYNMNTAGSSKYGYKDKRIYKCRLFCLQDRTQIRANRIQVSTNS